MLKVSKPIDSIRSSARRIAYRGSPSYGSPFGFTMSQIIRPTLASPSRVGISRYVDGSGIATMSDSSIALNPVIDEPSKPIPSLSAPSISEGVIAKLLRWPSMSVNQKRTYSTPSFSICFMTSLRAAGSDVARSLLSIIATFGCSSRGKLPEASSSQKAPCASALEQRAAEMHPLELPHVAEFLVDPAHRCVPEVVLRAQVAQPCRLRGNDLGLLERKRDAAPAVATRHAGHRVLAGVVGVLVEDGIPDDTIAVERNERELANGQWTEVP